MVRRASVSVFTHDMTERRVIITASNTPKRTGPDETVAERRLIDGLNKHAQTITSLVIAGATMTTKGHHRASASTHRLPQGRANDPRHRGSRSGTFSRAKRSRT